MTVFNLDNDAWVLAAPFRAHLHRLHDQSGLAWSVLALAAGVSPAAVRSLIAGRRGRPVRRIARQVACRLISLDETRLRSLAGNQVVAAPTAERVRQLLAQGWTPELLARWCHTTPSVLGGLGRALYCSELLALRVEAAQLAHERAVVAAGRCTGRAA
ncbi:MAG: hypothetical protein VB080_14035 [Propionicimonas sp.]|uniref:hypothetical protein n=1 Tax=Propionicimonas sp. TaxID=1955623 RepID=UPI002B1F9C30|nr:hypothetical protein [Propionicimonas sp.]MEA4945542.1 hypothetical protein [Propionicimonas sp.]MEA5052424.1 hypothetical protein [Propionicimonas sp.]